MSNWDGFIAWLEQTISEDEDRIKWLRNARVHTLDDGKWIDVTEISIASYEANIARLSPMLEAAKAKRDAGE